MAGAVTASMSVPATSCTRLRAFLIHLGLSAIIFVLLMACIVWLWYPGPYFRYDGGWRGTLIVIAVDLVLGPALTLVVFDSAKARRKIVLDLCVIGAIQAAALVWGIQIVEGQRPVAAAFHAGAFHPVTADLVRQQHGDLARIAALGRDHPPLVNVELPADPRARDEIMRRWREDGFALPTQPRLLSAFAPGLPGLEAADRVVAKIAAVNPGFRNERDAFFAAHPEVGGARLVPFHGRYGNVVFVIDAEARLRGVLTHAFEGIL